LRKNKYIFWWGAIFYQIRYKFRHTCDFQIQRFILIYPNITNSIYRNFIEGSRNWTINIFCNQCVCHFNNFRWTTSTFVEANIGCIRVHIYPISNTIWMGMFETVD